MFDSANLSEVFGGPRPEGKPTDSFRYIDGAFVYRNDAVKAAREHVAEAARQSAFAQRALRAARAELAREVAAPNVLGF